MDIQTVLVTNYSDEDWTLDGTEYSGLTWLSDTPKPTEAELKSQWAEVQYRVAYEAVSASRHTAYIAPSGSDAVFMKFQRGLATEQEWLDAVTTINEANPYPVQETK